MVPVTEVLFTLIVFIAVLGLFTEYAELVLTVTLLAVIWQLVTLLGVSLLLAIGLIAVATLFRLAAMAGGNVPAPVVARFLDGLLEQREAADRDRQEWGDQQAAVWIDTDVPSSEDDRR